MTNPDRSRKPAAQVAREAKIAAREQQQQADRDAAAKREAAAKTAAEHAEAVKARQELEAKHRAAEALDSLFERTFYSTLKKKFFVAAEKTHDKAGSEDRSGIAFRLANESHFRVGRLGEQLGCVHCSEVLGGADKAREWLAANPEPQNLGRITFGQQTGEDMGTPISFGGRRHQLG